MPCAIVKGFAMLVFWVQALIGSKTAARSPLRLFVEAETASACQQGAASMLAVLPFADDARDVASRAANTLRRALTILERHQRYGAQGGNGSKQSEACGESEWSEMLALVEEWKLADASEPLAVRMADLHVSLMQVALLQLQCDEAVAGKCAPFADPTRRTPWDPSLRSSSGLTVQLCCMLWPCFRMYASSTLADCRRLSIRTLCRRPALMQACVTTRSRGGGTRASSCLAAAP
jgi:hypothetical protein